MRRQPAVDLVVGPAVLSPAAGADRPRPPRRRRARWPPTSRRRRSSTPCRPRAAGGGVTAFLTVQEGCDKFCTFCVVPYTRGAEYSRPAEAIEAEARALADAGRARGHPAGPERQRLCAARAAWPALVRRLATIPGLDRIRYTTSHPRDMDDALIAAHAEVEALMPYLHLPVQSGSDRVLKAMNRGHTAEQLSAADRAHPRRAARHRALRRLHRRLPRRARGRLRGDARAGPRGRLRQRLLVQVFAPPRHAGRGHARPGRRGGEGRAAGAAAGAARRAAARLQRRPGRPHPAGAVREARPPPRPDRRPQPLSAGGALRGRRIA